MNNPTQLSPDCERFLAAIDESPSSAAISPPWQLHAESCEACGREWEVRQTMVKRLREAHQSVSMPPRLEARIRAAIDGDEQHRPNWFALPGWATAAAATMMVVAGVGIAYQLGHLRLTQSSQDAYIASVTNKIASIMRVGLRDHIHCTVFRKFPQQPPPETTFQAELGDEFRELIPVLRRNVPASYRMVTAHRCKYQGRPYVHLAMKDGSQLMSLVISEKAEGESFSTEQLRAVSHTDGVSFYQASAQRFQVSAFETPGHLVYAISEMDGERNTRILMAMAPEVRRVLSSTTAD